MQTAIITGGAGFIGSHVADRFLAEGYRVEIIDDLSSGRLANVPRDATLHRLDIESAAASSLICERRPDVLIHLAGQMDVRKSVADPRLDARINVLGTLNLLESVREGSPDTRVVFSSTGGVLYGDFVTPPNVETFAKDPESPYAISKLAVEHYLAYYMRVHGLDAVALRYGNVFGPRQDPHGEAGVVAIFCGRLIAGEPLTIYGSGEQTRDYVYVSDVVDATFRAAVQTLPPPGRLDARAFNIGTGVGTSVNRLATVLMDAAGRTVPVRQAPERRGEQLHSFVDPRKAADLLGWSPSVSLEAGLAESYRWFEARARSSVPATVAT